MRGVKSHFCALARHCAPRWRTLLVNMMDFSHVHATAADMDDPDLLAELAAITASSSLRRQRGLRSRRQGTGCVAEEGGACTEEGEQHRGGEGKARRGQAARGADGAAGGDTAACARAARASAGFVRGGDGRS